MKRIIKIFTLSFFLVSLGSLSAVSDTIAKDQPVSGSIVGGFRVLEVPEKSQDVELTVYRGDYLKFKLAGSMAEPTLSIPHLSIQQKLSANADETAYFKMEKAGLFPFTLGAAKGTIAVIAYQQANYREVNPREAAELIRNIRPLILDVRTPAEYGRGHLQDSVLIPVQQLQTRWQEIAGHKEKDLLIYCATGNRSTVAAKILIDNGFKRIFNLRQGMAGWEREKNPVIQ